MVDYDVGLGRKYWYCFVKGRKTPIAKKPFEELEDDKSVQAWARIEVRKYRRNLK